VRAAQVAPVLAKQVALRVTCFFSEGRSTGRSTEARRKERCNAYIKCIKCV